MNILEVILIICVLIQLFYIYAFFLALPEPKSAPIKSNSNLPGVSVVICARNEYKSLSINLFDILEQEYSQFEVVVVNDASTDGTRQLLQSLTEIYSNLKVVEISPKEKIHPGKKQALNQGIKTAKYPYILLTDADCKPVSKQWIKVMTESLNDESEVILGYSPGIKVKGMLNAFIRFDIFNTAIQYLNFAAGGIAYMGTGRNLAYQKSKVLNHKIDKHMNTVGGDDDLTVNQLSNKYNTSIVLNPESFVYTTTKQSLIDFWKQKLRHYSVSHKYKFIHILMLTLWNSSKLFLFLLIFTLVLVDKISTLTVIFILLYVISNTIMYSRNSKFLGNRDLILLSPILDVLSVFFNSFVMITNLFSKKVEWN